MIKRIAIRGGGFGDEGKGKLVNLLTRKAHICVRDQGGEMQAIPMKMSMER